ncbi:MAG: aminoglycoside phosphotransferase family protein [Verrucomicrobiota bacterium]
MSDTRQSIYYWKCDRPAAMHGVARSVESAEAHVLPKLKALLTEAWRGPVKLTPAGGKGNHRTYLLEHDNETLFVRVEDGPEGDGHLDVESRVMTEVAKTGVSVPRVRFTDASRSKVPFAVQVIEYFDCTDLNQVHRAGRLPLLRIAGEIGRAVARWQAVPVGGFGPFDAQATRAGGSLIAHHRSYAVYFRLHLERHLGLLEADGFLSKAEAAEVRGVIERHAGLLDIGEGVLVHKDLALWNIMGTEDGIRAFIDWDDAIAGDPTDDLSLLACFHPANVVQAAIEGYASVRSLPEDFEPRFWLHLLRNMIVKSVIRCGAGYFNQTRGGAFLMAPGQDGPAFKVATREKLFSACRGLDQARALTHL